MLVEISLTRLAILDTALMDTRGQFSEFWQTLLLEKRKILILEPGNEKIEEKCRSKVTPTSFPSFEMRITTV